LTSKRLAAANPRRLPGRVAASLAAVTVLAGCYRAAGQAQPSSSRPSVARSASASAATPPLLPPTSPSPTARAGPCLAPNGFTCAMAARIRQVQRYLAGRPGRIGIVLHDRQTGATWQNAAAHTAMPAASTIKLAMVTDLMLRNGSGAIQLTSGDWDLIHHALHESSDVAADSLWFAFENAGFLGRIRALGMRSAYFTTPSSPYWGFMYCSATDLDRLMNYILGHIPAGARSYITKQIRHVAPIQQWGVWGAGPENHPGNKDGWEDDGGTWITDTVGFAGPRARYTLAIMYDSQGAGDFHYGSTTLTEVAALLFQGHPAPAPTAEATP
jgi:hypothetical protein